MFNYVLVVEDDKGNQVTKFQLEQGESRKGTYTTLSGVTGNKALPFGKLYIDTAQIAKPKKS